MVANVPEAPTSGQNRVHILLGKETLQKNDYIQSLKKSSANTLFREFLPQPKDLQECLDWLGGGDFFGGAKLAVLHDFQELKLKDAQSFCQQIGTIPNTNHLVILSTVSALGKDRNLAGLKGTKTSVFHIPFDRDLPAAVCRLGSRHDLKVNAAAAVELIDVIGKDLSLIDKALSVLTLYLYPEKSLTKQVVGDFYQVCLGADVFALFDRVILKDTAGSLFICHDLLKRGLKEHEIMAAFSSQFDRFAQAYFYKLEAGDMAAYFQANRIHSFAASAIQKQLNYMDSKRFLRMTRQLLEFDVNVKSGRTYEGAMEMLVGDICL